MASRRTRSNTIGEIDMTPSTSPPGGSQRGQALALFTLAITVLLGAAGLVVDGGLVFINRRDAQNAADLGAMAGTHTIAEFHTQGIGRSDDVWSAVDSVVQANGCTSGGNVPCTWTATYVRPAASGPGTELMSAVPNSNSPIPSTAQGVMVSIDRRPPTVLLPALGLTEWAVDAEARALTAQIGNVPAGLLLPIAVDPLDPPNTFQPGETHILSLGQDAPGQFSWLTWNGDHNQGTLASNMCTPQNPAIDLTDADTTDDWIEGDNGKSNSTDVRDCLTGYVGRIILLPTYDVTQGLGGSLIDYHITGFTFWRLLDFEANPFIDNLRATFMGYGPARVSQDYNGPPCNAAVDAACQQYSFFIGLVE